GDHRADEHQRAARKRNRKRQPVPPKQPERYRDDHNQRKVVFQILPVIELPLLGNSAWVRGIASGSLGSATFRYRLHRLLDSLWYGSLHKLLILRWCLLLLSILSYCGSGAYRRATTACPSA